MYHLRGRKPKRQGRPNRSNAARKEMGRAKNKAKRKNRLSQNKSQAASLYPKRPDISANRKSQHLRLKDKCTTAGTEAVN